MIFGLLTYPSLLIFLCQDHKSFLTSYSVISGVVESLVSTFSTLLTLPSLLLIIKKVLCKLKTIYALFYRLSTTFNGFRWVCYCADHNIIDLIHWFVFVP
eukprot:UN17928